MLCVEDKSFYFTSVEVSIFVASLNPFYEFEIFVTRYHNYYSLGLQ
jgi:hypothetical protein